MRTYTIKNVLERKPKILKLDGIWKEMLGEPERGKMWLIYGREKQGKTWLAMLLFQALARNENVLYVSAEEGLGKSIQDVILRANIDVTNKRHKMKDKVPFEEIKAYLQKRYAPKIVIIDNVTVFQDDLRAKSVDNLMDENKDKIFIFIAHEERGEPYTAPAKRISKLADRIIRVEGLRATIGGRLDGKKYLIDTKKAMIIHGTETEEITNN